MNISALKIGSIWFVNLDPVIGHEQAKKRPCLIISDDIFNQSAEELVVILPITSRERKFKYWVEINAPEGGLRCCSYIMCDQIRTISWKRLDAAPLGYVTELTLHKIMQRLEILL